MVEVRSRGEVLFRDVVSMSPAKPYQKQLKQLGDFSENDLSLVISSAGAELLRCQPNSWSGFSSGE